MEKEKKTQKSRTEGVKRRRKKVRGAGVWERGLQTKDIPKGAGQADWSSLVPQGPGRHITPPAAWEAGH